MNFNNPKHLALIGFFVALVGFILWFVFIHDVRVGSAWYNQCRYNQCVTPVLTQVPSVSPEPSVEPSVSPEPTVTETPTATPSPTEVPGNPDVSDGRSDGRSDGLCSKPPCVDNRSGQPLLPPSNSGK